MRKGYKMLMVGGAGVIAAGAVGGYVLARPQTSVVETTAYEIPIATNDDLESVAGLRVFFGHQSVGNNILSAMPGLYAADGQSPLEIVESADATAADGPAILHLNIGTNGDPLGKVAEFDRVMRAGMGDSVDVAVLKLCYIDFHDGDDVSVVFGAYRDLMANLERDFPDVTFIYTTVPITIERGPLGRVKDRLGRGDHLGPEHNVTREAYNALIRSEYESSGRLFDIAAIQAAGSDETRTLLRYNGANLYGMSRSFASDPGHLNPDGAEAAASALLAMISNANG